MSGEAIRQAVILVGGKGTRLGALTRAVPKPMLPIAGGRPLVEYLLEMIERHGYRDIILLAGHLGEALEAAYDRRRIGEAMVRVMREPVPLGTAGALTVAREALDPRFLLHERRRLLRHQFARAGAGFAPIRRYSDPRFADSCRRCALRAGDRRGG